MPTVKRLDSGYWHVRWNHEIWAQWPTHRMVTDEDFFHHTGTPDRIREATALTLGAASSDQETA